MCVCTWTPVNELCLDYEVVVLQPLTATPRHLGSVAIVTLKLALPSHLFLPFVWIFILPPPSYHPPIRSQSLSKYSLFCTRYQPPLPAQRPTHLDIARTWHPSDSATCLCSPRRLPASFAVPVTMRPPPYYTLGLRPYPCRPLGGLIIAGPYTPMCPRLALPKLPSKSYHYLVHGLLSDGFLRKGKRPGQIHHLAVARPGPFSPCYLTVLAPCFKCLNLITPNVSNYLSILLLYMYKIGQAHSKISSYEIYIQNWTIII